MPGVSKSRQTSLNKSLGTLTDDFFERNVQKNKKPTVFAKNYLVNNRKIPQPHPTNFLKAEPHKKKGVKLLAMLTFCMQ